VSACDFEPATAGGRGARHGTPSRRLPLPNHVRWLEYVPRTHRVGRAVTVARAAGAGKGAAPGRVPP
jgi:hypothetical protein